MFDWWIYSALFYLGLGVAVLDQASTTWPRYREPLRLPAKLAIFLLWAPLLLGILVVYPFTRSR